MRAHHGIGGIEINGAAQARRVDGILQRVARRIAQNKAANILFSNIGNLPRANNDSHGVARAADAAASRALRAWRRKQHHNIISYGAARRR